MYKKNKNLWNRLVRADIETTKKQVQSTIHPPKTGTFPCLHCAHCSNVIKGSTFTHPRKVRPIPIWGFHTCDTSHVVYLLKCSCGLLYMGETSQRMKDFLATNLQLDAKRLGYQYQITLRKLDITYYRYVSRLLKMSPDPEEEETISNSSKQENLTGSINWTLYPLEV